MAKKMKKETIKKVAMGTAGAVGGLAAGAALGALFAPKSGKETRKQIKAKINKMGSDVKTGTKNMQDKVSKRIEKIKTTAKAKS